jgi:hypothetical protein
VRAPRHGSQQRGHSIANIVFSLSAAAASLLIAILAAIKGAPVVALVWGVLAVGFVVRAAYGYRRGRRD